MISCTTGHDGRLQAYTVDSIPAAVRRMHQSPICQPPGVCSTDWVSWVSKSCLGWHDGGTKNSSYTKKQAVSVGEWVFLDFLSGMWKGSYKVKKNTTLEVIYLKPFPHCSSCPWNGAFNGFEIVEILEQVLKSQAKHLW